VAAAVKERSEGPRKSNTSTIGSQWELAAVSAAVLEGRGSHKCGELAVIDIEGQVPRTLVVWFPTRNVLYDLVWNDPSQAQPEMDYDFESHES
jgi:hypothetical protein